MPIRHDLSSLSWTLNGYTPECWRPQGADGTQRTRPEISVPVKVPGSVQGALLAAGLIPDWHDGLNHRACEWIEHRCWAFSAELPDAWCSGGPLRLHCAGLDHAGWILLNHRQIGTFANVHLAVDADMTPHLRASGNRLEIIFDLPPRWLGQTGFTSRMIDWKPRFYYTWDWTVRVVQIGITGAVELATDGPVIAAANCRTVGADGVVVRADAGGRPLRLRLSDATGRILREEVFTDRCTWSALPVATWWPNGAGAQPLYGVACDLLGADGTILDQRSWQVGFKTVEWLTNPGAPAGADPWLCAVNGRPLFLQGINWVPVRCTFADVPVTEIRARLVTYRDLGCNVVRVWGGAGLESAAFYAICDELGLLVWQEFPLSSSGLENWPPEDPASVAALEQIARAWIPLRQHHACLLMWCGGNELQGGPGGERAGVGRPIDGSQAPIVAMARAVAELDPGRRFLPTSASGPRFMAAAEEFDKGLHWDVHGPWVGENEDYWQRDDALFRSEVGTPGAAPAELIRRYAGGLPLLPADFSNPLWRICSWWLEWDAFKTAHAGREPADLEEYVAWSQARQAEFLVRAARACKSRFPRCGGFILWMGHDAFPCAVNTSILDFHGQPKPAALALAEVFKTPAAST